MSPRWNCWPTTAAGSITARPRGPSRSRRASSRAWIEVGTDRDRRSAASSDSTARSSGRRPSAAGLVPEVGDQLLDQQREALGPLADVGLDGLVDPPPSRWTTSCSPSRSGRGRAGTTACWPSPWPVGAAREQLVRAGHAEQHQRRVGVLGHVLEGIEQDRVGPLEVVDDQHQWPAAGQGLQQPLQGPEGVLGQVGVLAEAEQLGDPLGDERGPGRLGEQLGQPAPGLRGGVVGAIPAACLTTSTIGHRVTLSPKAGQWPRRTWASSPRPLTNSSTRRDLPTPAEPSTLTRWQVRSAAPARTAAAAAPARGPARPWARPAAGLGPGGRAARRAAARRSAARRPP